MAQALSTEVREHNGAPALFINGKPDAGLPFYVTAAAKNREEVTDFGKEGVHLVSGSVSLGRCMTQGGGCDFAPIDALMKTFLDANPQALVLPRVDLTPPDWWMEKHPDAWMRHYDPATGLAPEHYP